MLRVEMGEEPNEPTASERLAEIWQAYVGQVLRAVRRALVVLESTAKRLVSGPRTGHVYRRRGVVHQASRPGEPPAVDRGVFRNSITHEEPEVSGAEVTGRWGSNDVRARLFEDGGWAGEGHRSHILARPWARPAEDEALAQVDAILEDI